MLRFGKTKVAKEKFYGAKRPVKMLDVNAYNIVISKSVETRNNSKYLIEYSDEVIRPLVLILPKLSGYVKTFQDKGGYKNKNNKLMSLRIGNDRLLEKYETIWTRIENLEILSWVLYQFMMVDI